MKKIAVLTLCLLANLLSSFGQSTSFYKTTRKRNLHYVEVTPEMVKVYKMGVYYSKAGTGSAVLKKDTLYRLSDNEFKGRYYSLNKVDGSFTLQNDEAKKLFLEIEPDTSKVNLALNNAYYLKSYYTLNKKLYSEFPLNHHWFNPFHLWDELPEKTYHQADFIQFTDNEIKKAYDSVSKIQIRLTNASKFIKENAAKLDYSQLRDSLKTLPVEYRGQSEYFEQSVYAIAKAKPEHFYKILEDFPSEITKLYFAVEDDKELIKQIRAVEGYDSLKKEFVKERRAYRTLLYPAIFGYGIPAALLTWVILSQKD